MQIVPLILTFYMPFIFYQTSSVVGRTSVVRGKELYTQGWAESTTDPEGYL
jgi:tRNA(Phe) wybutosine-synthesizing methylase Tyw3